jgi:hypothetical protein
MFAVDVAGGLAAWLRSLELAALVRECRWRAAIHTIRGPLSTCAGISWRAVDTLALSMFGWPPCVSRWAELALAAVSWAALCWRCAGGLAAGVAELAACRAIVTMR